MLKAIETEIEINSEGEIIFLEPIKALPKGKARIIILQEENEVEKDLDDYVELSEKLKDAPHIHLSGKKFKPNVKRIDVGGDFASQFILEDRR